jgi:hypothetical protein
LSSAPVILSKRTDDCWFNVTVLTPMTKANFLSLAGACLMTRWDVWQRAFFESASVP